MMAIEWSEHTEWQGYESRKGILDLESCSRDVGKAASLFELPLESCSWEGGQSGIAIRVTTRIMQLGRWAKRQESIVAPLSSSDAPALASASLCGTLRLSATKTVLRATRPDGTPNFRPGFYNRFVECAVRGRFAPLPH